MAEKSKRGGARPGAGRKRKGAPAAVQPETKASNEGLQHQAVGAEKAPGWAQAAKSRVGRPSVYEPAMCERLIEYGMEGCTVVEMAARLGIRKSTLYEWAKDKTKPEFSDALACARELSEAFHAERYRLGCALPSNMFNAAAYAKFMGVVFSDWREVTRTEHTGADGGPIETAEVSDRDIAQRAAYLLQRGLMAPAKAN